MNNLFFLRFFFLGDDFAPIIIAAVRAHNVRQAHLATIGAGDQVGSGQRVVRAAAVAAAFGVFAFWMWWHGQLLQQGNHNPLSEGRWSCP